MAMVEPPSCLVQAVVDQALIALGPHAMDLSEMASARGACGSNLVKPTVTVQGEPAPNRPKALSCAFSIADVGTALGLLGMIWWTDS